MKGEITMKAFATTTRDIDELVSYVETAELAALSERAAFGFTASPYEDEKCGRVEGLEPESCRGSAG